jgi:uncharacterized protein (DUF885 family)
MTRAALLLLLAAAAWAGPEDDKLLRLIDEQFEASMRRWPTWATERGDRRFDDQLADESPQARQQWLEHERLRLAAAREIDSGKLTKANRTNLMLLRYELEKSIAEARFHKEQVPISQMWGPQRSLPQLAARISFTSPKHFDDYITRLELVPAYLDQIIANMRSGLAAGRVPPRLVVEPAVQQTRVHANASVRKDQTLHAMYPPFKKARRDRPPRSARARPSRRRSSPLSRSSPSFSRPSTSRSAATRSPRGTASTGSPTTSRACVRTRRSSSVRTRSTSAASPR